MSKKDEQEQKEIEEMLSGLTKDQIRAMLLADMAEKNPSKHITEAEIKEQIEKVKK